MTHDLDTLITELNCQITANLERQLTKLLTARERILALEEWSDAPQLWYADYFAILPEQLKLDCATLVSQISQLRVSVEYFAPYLLCKHVDPLLKTEAQALYVQH